MARSQAIRLQVEELFAFADVAGDMNLVDLTFGPGARVTALLASAPLRGQCFPVLGWQEFEGKKEGWAAHTIVTFEDGTLASTEYAVVMAAQPRRFVEAFPLPNRTWLLPGFRSHIVVDGSGTEVHRA